MIPVNQPLSYSFRLEMMKNNALTKYGFKNGNTLDLNWAEH